MTIHRLLVASTDGVRQLLLDTATGTADPIGTVLPYGKSLAVTAHPAVPRAGWVASADDGGRLVAVTATDDGVRVEASTGSDGAVPCHVAVRDGQVAVANYSGHTVAVFPYHHDSGHRTAGPAVVHHFGEQSHPHQVLEVDGQLVVSDLGRDGLHVLAPDADPAPADEPPAIPLEPGAGPRNAVRVGPDHLVVALERANAAAVVELQRDAAGTVVGGRQVDRCGFDGETSATHPSQIRLAGVEGGTAQVLVLNRGSDRLCVLEVTDGRFGGKAVEHPLPAWPMDLLRLDDVLLVACRDADLLVGLDATDLGPDGAARTLFSVPVPQPNGVASVGTAS